MNTERSKTIIVAADGSGDVASVEAAVERAQPGDTIRLGVGTYQLRTPLRIEKSLRFEGAGMDKSRIMFSGQEFFLMGLVGNCEWHIQDIAFERSGRHISNIVVTLRDVCKIQVRRCSFSGAVYDETEETGGMGLQLGDNTSGLVTECVSTRNGSAGILAASQADLVLEGNRCYENGRTGILFGGNARGTARNNECVKNGFGIQVRDQAQPTLENNRCNENNNGIMYGENAAGVASNNECVRNEAGIIVSDQAHPVLEGNRCRENKTFGIGYVGNAAGTARNNECVENGEFGVCFAEATPRPTLVDNVCSPNGLGDIYTPEPQSKGCFIVTAAYGSPLVPQVVFLRNFRDEYLLSTKLGQSFVRIYEYLSPPVAKVIARYHFLRVLTRHCLIVPLVWLTKLWSRTRRGRQR